MQIANTTQKHPTESNASSGTPSREIKQVNQRHMQVSTTTTIDARKQMDKTIPGATPQIAPNLPTNGKDVDQRELKVISINADLILSGAMFQSLIRYQRLMRRATRGTMPE